MTQFAQSVLQRLTAKMPQVLRTSVACKAMVFLALPIGGLSILLGCVGYQHSVNSLETQTHDRLREYLNERSKQESQIFELAQRNHAHLKPLLLDRITQSRLTHPDAEFNALISQWTDGTSRNFPQNLPIHQFDSQKESTVLIGRGVPLTRTLKQDVLAAKSITDIYGPAWSPSFVDTWIIGSVNNFGINYWKGTPWGLQAPANTDMTQEEYGTIAQKSKNPDRTPRWTGVYRDTAAQKWMVSLVTPVDDRQGNHIASIGNDIVLDDLVRRTESEYLPDARNIIFSKEGHLIADSQHQTDPKDFQSSPLIDPLQSPILQELLNKAHGMTKPIDVSQSSDGQSIVGIAPLSGTDWYLATIYPNKIIAQQAMVYTLPIVSLTAFALILEIFYIYFILRHQIVHPLQQIVSATRKVADNHFNLDLNITRRDEIGELSRSVTQMADTLERSFAALEHQNETLESQVTDRTADLTQALEELQFTQTQLIQSEKMSGLGQMVAGIAHEINNPVSFIHGNLTPTRTYITDLLQHLHLYQTSASTDEIQIHAEDIDLEFLIDDLPKILSSMKVGTDRIREIVLSLRNFSRLDESDRKTVDIHEGIESTLLILNHRLKRNMGTTHGTTYDTIQIHKNYGTHGSIACFPSQLNQVIMNLLSNSIDALDTHASSQPHPTITITTDANIRQNYLQIRIQDNGSGIPKAVQSRMFDPFFTTKAIGKGTGLGLSISYQIITLKHHGTLVCHSSPEHGTTFTITLPIDPTESSSSPPASLPVSSPVTPSSSPILFLERSLERA